jgi:hypothetical protein
MAVYPQLGSGALGQFPVRKRRRLRTVVNQARDGRTVRLADPAGEITEWQLEYSELTDAETAALQGFFDEVEGSLRGFTFVDPSANLLAWSEKLDEAVWEAGPLLTIAAAITDPFGETRASRLSNTGGAAQGLSQTLSAPPEYVYCFSAYLRSAAPVTVTILRGTARADRKVSSEWRRITFSGAGEVTFGLELPAGATVDVYGLQVEPQPAASGYKTSTSGGVYEHARLRDDVLAITATGVERHSCTVNIIHANHL